MVKSDPQDIYHLGNIRDNRMKPRPLLVALLMPAMYRVYLGTNPSSN